MKTRSNPHKLAIFVEGQTEQRFIVRLIEELASENQLSIVQKKAEGGRKFSRRLVQLSATGNQSTAPFFVLVVDSGSDSSVASDIREQYDSLAKSYAGIIGLRDVAPISPSDVQKVRNNFGFGIKTKPISPVLLLSVMEIEAWFLSEINHFQTIHSGLTPERILADTGIDVVSGALESIPNPSSDLDAIYRLEGFRYTKNKKRISRTVDALDIDALYSSPPNTVPEIRKLLDTLDHFFSGHDWRDE